MSAPEPAADAERPWSLPHVSPPVGANDIRRWAIATYWPERPPPRHTDPDHPGGMIAPRDFNPFAWMLDPAPPVAGADRSDFPDHPRVMNGGQSDRYGAPIRPGDVITSRSRIAMIESRATRLGDTRFVSTEQLWLNQHGAFVRSRLSTLIRY